MSKKHITRVAIVGATGRIGGAFAQSLLQTGQHTVTALTREDSQSKLPNGVRAVRVKYDDEDSLVNALNGQQFLVITLSVRAPEDLHARITAAAGKAGVPYIMPNAYGFPLSPEGVKDGDAYGKSVLERISDAQNGVSSSVTLSCGFWYEWSLASGEQWFGFTIKDRKVTFFDEGTRIISISTWDQCGRALAALLSLPESGSTPALVDFKNKEVRINSFRVSQRDILDSLHRVLGTTDSDWEITHESVAKRLADGADELSKGIFTGFAKMLYGGVFSPANKEGDFAGIMELANDTLRLPKEDLDEATQRAVDMVAAGWTPFRKMSEKIKDAVLAEVKSSQAIAHDVITSGAYLYPFKGIVYFAAHKDLWRPFISRAGRTITLGVGVTTVMFFFTYVPQMAIMAFTSGPLAAISAAILVLGESSAITSVLSRSFLIEDALIDTFDGTLVARDQEPLVAQGRQMKPRSGGRDAMARLGKIFTRPLARLNPRALLRSLLYLPLNLIPVVGTVLYIFMQGKRAGPILHARYFQLKGWDSTMREEWVKKNQGAYTGLGIAAFVLEMVPFASIAFSFTNTVGAALWAADLEKATK
ncbi:hypothetical protein DTO006G1_2494 [Penicillium roqueforti]|uniref:uncharacterized protein n=1 Tax=Penicillium roqueforti TaxID=5082 RepID=UPI0019091648|nr:uncharacterized protein LCP9604111_1897 [Penicillium roqueforti]KAF9251901.1 hypothetical protein LCP9604111_1897 [Penicillium roqueforti]KAI1836285.1 hypothetical protein CBS147337_2512 [Penicillium roqueforti]KAI2702562.1 hypothetical protein CBS147372_4295 [Penicillium roqueforti]KAI2729458.1 hypothetical protein CBS147354_843 [Penicillium roqueforti]KAI2762557.1 hypothetical protein DTO006G1_2494 [Penicillium roqueforti]